MTDQPKAPPSLIRWERDRRRGRAVPKLKPRFWFAALRLRAHDDPALVRALEARGVRLDPPVNLGRWDEVAR